MVMFAFQSLQSIAVAGVQNDCSGPSALLSTHLLQLYYFFSLHICTKVTSRGPQSVCSGKNTSSQSEIITERSTMQPIGLCTLEEASLGFQLRHQHKILVSACLASLVLISLLPLHIQRLDKHISDLLTLSYASGGILCVINVVRSYSLLQYTVERVCNLLHSENDCMRLSACVCVFNLF